MAAPLTPRGSGGGGEGRPRSSTAEEAAGTPRDPPAARAARWRGLSVRTGRAAGGRGGIDDGEQVPSTSTTSTPPLPGGGGGGLSAGVRRRRSDGSAVPAAVAAWAPPAAATGPPGSPLIVGDGLGIIGRRRISSVGDGGGGGGGDSECLEPPPPPPPLPPHASRPPPAATPRSAARPRRPAWVAATAVLGPEIASNLAYYSISVDLVVYLSVGLGRAPGAAAAQAHTWTGLAYLFPLLGGAVADGVAGRPATVMGAAALQAVGLVLLTLQAWLLAPAAPGAPPPAGADAAFGLAMAALAAATGGIKPNVSPCGADQFDAVWVGGGGEEEEGGGGGDGKGGRRAGDDEEGGRRQEASPASSPDQPRSAALLAQAAAAEAAKASFFNWYYFAINVGALGSSAGLVYLQTAVSWPAGFGVPAGCAALAAALYGAAYAKGWIVDTARAGGAGRAAGGSSTSGLVRLGRAVRRWVGRAWVPCGRPKGAVAPGGGCGAVLPPDDKAAAEEDADAAQLGRLLPAWLALLGWNLAYATASTVMVQQVRAGEGRDI